MSIYPLSPCPNFQGETPYQTWEDGFTSNECHRIINYGESLNPRPATVGNNIDTNVVNCIRTSKTAWLECNNDTKWLYERLGNILRVTNGMFWKFDIRGFHEHIQYTVYEGDDKGFYRWHVDNNMQSDVPPRKLSMTVQLSDPSEYTGGELQLHDGEVQTAVNSRGHVIIFPSYVLHRVQPVTSGIRRSLVIWANGPGFK